MSILPQGFSIEESSSQGYFNIKKLDLDTKNKFRIIGNAIGGYCYWKDENGKPKPVRLKNKPSVIPAECKPDKDGKKNITQFLALPIWEYSTGQVKVMELTQKTIMKALDDYSINEDWGDVTKYDFNITRSKDGEKVEYKLSPVPHKALPQDVTDSIAIVMSKFNLEELFSGGNPFEPKTLPAPLEKEKQLVVLESLIKDFETDRKAKFNDYIGSTYSVESVDELTLEQIVEVINITKESK